MGKYFFADYKNPFGSKAFHTAIEGFFPRSCLSSELSLVALTLIHGSLTLFDKDIKFDSVKA